MSIYSQSCTTQFSLLTTTTTRLHRHFAKMSSQEPQYGPLPEDEALYLWMQNRCSVSWPKVLPPELYQPPSPSPRPAPPKQSTVVQNSYLLSLPLECLQQIILLLDIKSVFQFRRTAIECQQKVESLFEFRRMTKKHAHDLLDVIFKHEVAEHINLSKFYYRVCNKYCCYCNNVANYLNIQTWKRVCLPCAHAKGRSGYQTHSTDETKYVFRILALIRLGIEEKMILGSNPDPRTFRFPLGNNTELHDQILINVPPLDPKTGRFECGVCCDLCLMDWCVPERVYDREGFLEHFRQCEDAQREWTQELNERTTTLEEDKSQDSKVFHKTYQVDDPFKGL